MCGKKVLTQIIVSEISILIKEMGKIKKKKEESTLVTSLGLWGGDFGEFLRNRATD